jgi:TetR/AcrR family fatty acid metabolism transcriptional regulator
MAPRPDVSAARKQQILDAAIVVFARQGFHKARMDDIAEEVGVSKGTLYWYFKSKDAIILSLLEHLFAVEFEEVNQLLTVEMRASDRLRMLSDQFAAMFQDRFGDIMPIIYEYYATAVRQDDVMAFLRDYFHGYLDVIAAFVRAGVESGEFRADVDPAATAFLIAASWEGAAFLWFIDERQIDLKHFSETTMNVLFNGLLARS